MQGGGGGGAGGALVYLGAISAAEAAAVPIANAERARRILFITRLHKHELPNDISRATYTTHRTKAVTQRQQQMEFGQTPNDDASNWLYKNNWLCRTFD